MACCKLPYPSRVEAQRAIKRIQSKRTTQGAPTRAYRCPGCGHWHITTKPQSRKARSAAYRAQRTNPT